MGDMAEMMYDKALEQEFELEVNTIKMNIVIDGINRTKGKTEDGSREFEKVGVLPVETEVTDVNGDTIELNGRWLNGFRDKNGETDGWAKGMTIKLQIVEVEYTRKDGSMAKAVNFRLPEGVSSIVEESTDDDF